MTYLHIAGGVFQEQIKPPADATVWQAWPKYWGESDRTAHLQLPAKAPTHVVWVADDDTQNHPVRVVVPLKGEGDEIEKRVDATLDSVSLVRGDIYRTP